VVAWVWGQVLLILSFKPGHDGTVALVRDGVLEFSIEAEKDSFPRYADLTPALVLDAFDLVDEVPDVVCLSGWVKGFHSMDRRLGAGLCQRDDVRHSYAPFFAHGHFLWTCH
jgi:predicted NodU family carbamoyl transferase